MIHEIIIPFIWLIIPLVAISVLYKIRTTYKIAQLKTQDKILKKESTIEGSIIKMIDNAPNQIKQIEQEIITIKSNATKTNMTPEQLKGSIERLEREKDMLMIPAKYGEVAKPFLKPLDKIVSKFMGNLGNG